MNMLIFISVVSYFFVGLGFSVGCSIYGSKKVYKTRRISTTFLMLYTIVEHVYLSMFWPAHVLAALGVYLYKYCANIADIEK